MHVRVRELVGLASLDIAEALAALKQPQVKQVLCNDLESLQYLAIGAFNLCLIRVFDRFALFLGRYIVTVLLRYQ